jgi:hypothetical protein
VKYDLISSRSPCFSHLQEILNLIAMSVYNLKLLVQQSMAVEYITFPCCHSFSLSLIIIDVNIYGRL